MPPERSDVRLRVIAGSARGESVRSLRAPLHQPALAVGFSWPTPAPGDVTDNFFVGLWHPTRPLEVTAESSATPHCEAAGVNWWMTSALSPLHDEDTGLVHANAPHEAALAFRGYLTDPPLHSYSDPSSLLRYWTSPIGREHNGVFSAAIVAAGGHDLTLITDAFGLSPLYYRRFGEAIAFSTSPRYLATEADVPDRVAWRCMLESEFLAGDRTLTTSVQRVPAGKKLTFTAREERTTSWFDFDRLPAGTRPIDRTALADMEDALQQSVARCLRLDVGQCILPLSSGHDSRRILAALLAQRASFSAITARIFQWGHRDLDGPFASQIAAAYGVPHHVVQPATGRQFVVDDRVRRMLVDAETTNHTWVVRLFDALPSRPALLFDGLLGDILGQPGFRLPGLYQSPERDLQIIVDHCVRGAFDRELRASRWPSAEDVRTDMRVYLSQFLGRANFAELAFILMRQRRSTALWAQQLLGPGHVVACPYADLDYVKLMLDFAPKDKHAVVCQKACLQEFWPELARFPGNRDIPASVPEGSPAFAHARHVEAFHAMWHEIVRHGGRTTFTGLLSGRAMARLSLSRSSRPATVRSTWCLNPLMEMMSREAERRPCWDLTG